MTSEAVLERLEALKTIREQVPSEKYEKAVSQLDKDFIARQGRLGECLSEAEINDSKSLRKNGRVFTFHDLEVFLSLSNKQWSIAHSQAYEELSQESGDTKEFLMFAQEVSIASEMFEKDSFPLKVKMGLQVVCEKIN